MMHELRETFMRDGYVRVPRPSFRIDLPRLEDEYRALALAAGSPDGPLVVYEAANPRQICRLEYLAGASAQLRAHVVAPLCTLISELAGVPFLLFKDKCNLKHPGGGAFPAHQDIAAYRHFNTAYQITGALMLDAATATNGALEMAASWPVTPPGASLHATPRGPLPVLPSYEGGDRHGEIISALSADIQWQLIEAEPGELLLFDSYVPHRSQINRGASSRRIMLFTFAMAADGDLYECYYQAKRAAPHHPMFHIGTPTARDPAAAAAPGRLFTPGPLTTSAAVKRAANRDMLSRGAEAIALTASLRAAIAALAGCDARYSVIPLTGSGTSAVEAMLSSLITERDHVLVVENGVYSRRMVEICRRHHLRHSVLACDPMAALPHAAVQHAVRKLGDVSHIAAVHFETGLGVLNDIDALGQRCSRWGIRLLIDAVSTFGALPLDYADGMLAGVAISANKCLHGLPGLAFVIADTEALRRLPVARTLSLDLQAQLGELCDRGQWRYTPPLQAMLALERALHELERDGGRPSRYARYVRLAERLVDGMASLGLVPLVDAAFRAPFITTFHARDGVLLDVAALTDYLSARGLFIYASVDGQRASFRVGVLGELVEQDIDDLLLAIRQWQAGGNGQA